MEIGLSEVIKFCTRKLIKRTHFMSPLKMINLFHDIMPNPSPKNVGFEVSRPTIFMINRTQLRPKTQGFLRLQISTLCQENIGWTSPFLLRRWISHQIFKEKGRGWLYMITVFRWEFLRKMGLWFFRGVGGAVFTWK